MLNKDEKKNLTRQYAYEISCSKAHSQCSLMTFKGKFWFLWYLNILFSPISNKDHYSGTQTNYFPFVSPKRLKTCCDVRKLITHLADNTEQNLT
jgi:hypothetical protein